MCGTLNFGLLRCVGYMIARAPCHVIAHILISPSLIGFLVPKAAVHAGVYLSTARIAFCGTRITIITRSDALAERH